MQSNTFRKISASLSLIVLFVCMVSCKQTSSQKVIRLAHTLNTKHPIHHSLVFFGEKLEEKSGGKLTVAIYHSQQLGTERECLELLQIGSLGITKVSSAVLENFSKEFKVFSLPYLFDGKEHQKKVLSGNIGAGLLSTLEDVRLKGLCFYDSGSRSFYTKKNPITNPDDLKGLKVRVMQSQNAIDMVNAMGGTATPIAFGELYTALQQGVVDAAENNSPSFVSSKHYEICKYYSIDEHSSIPDVLIMSQLVWDSLTEEEKGWVTEAAKESAVFQFDLWAKSEKECMEKLKEEGVQISYPDKALFSQKVDEIKSRYNDDASIKDIIKQIENID